MNDPEISKVEDTILTLDTVIYSLTAIKKTVYRFADKASIQISPCEGTSVNVIFRRISGGDSLIAIKSAFLMELNDQDLREIIRKETEPLRCAILAHAFSKTSLVKQK